MQAVLFDLNGTLVDSERAHWLAYQEVLGARGIGFTFEEFSEDWTQRGYGLVYTLRKHQRDDLVPNAPDIKRKKDEIFRATLTERVTLLSGADTAVTALERAFPLGLDSTSSREDVMRLLRHFGLDRFFRAISTADMPWDRERYGTNSKGSRFRWLADALSCLPQQCVVIGDAEKDVTAAKESGMAVIIVPADGTRGEYLSSADRVLQSLAELDPPIVRGLLP